MGVRYLVEWQNVEAKGSIDLIDADLLCAKQHKKGLTHATHFGDAVCTSTFDIEPDRDALLFRYGGSNSNANTEQKIYIGDMRIIPAKFATATELEWRDNERQDWTMVPVKIERLASKEGARRKRRSTYVSRDSALAFFKRADAKAKGGLKCEACGFKGLAAYGGALEQCFEVHHKHLLLQATRVTELDDLALVCANCHNAIHGLGDKDFGDFASRFTN
jgi:predicted HNH restriction endonuclease